MPQVIEWTNVGAEDIVWRYPVEDITWGAQLVVQEYEMAVFFRDGKAYDVFGAGRHTLTTLNLPLLTGLLTRLVGFGGNKPFKATVYSSAPKFSLANGAPVHKPPNSLRCRYLRTILVQSRRRITVC
jgi:membrane protease subunit (stomatin/prohibitin family)